jgi:hypothetical protein
VRSGAPTARQVMARHGGDGLDWVQRRLTAGEACGAGGDNGVALQHHGVKGEVKSVPKWKDTELWWRSPERRKTAALGSKTG